MKPGYDFALTNRIRREISARQGPNFQAWFARPEDVIVGKLMAWHEGRSFKHESDIRDILTAVKLGDDPELSTAFDPAYVDQWASKLGKDVEEFWQNLKRLITLDDE